MHGIIFTALKKYVRTRLGDEAWTNLRTAAGLRDRVYLPVQAYPDEEIDALVHTVASLSGIPTNQLLRDFGKSLVPDFLQMYRALIQPSWRTLDLLEHVEGTVHRGIRANGAGTNPPVLEVHRPDPGQVVIEYRSRRQWCALGHGIIEGVAAHYGEPVQVVEDRCQQSGADSCRLVVSVRGEG